MVGWKVLFPICKINFGIQNDCLDLTINEFLTIWKTQHCSKRYLQICEMKKTEKLQISLAMMLRFPNR